VWGDYKSKESREKRLISNYIIMVKAVIIVGVVLLLLFVGVIFFLEPGTINEGNQTENTMEQE